MDRRVLLRMRDTMANRGPDGAGDYWLGPMAMGHRRLAIRDQEHGHQPWLSPSRQCALVYNGEIYNDAELRSEISALGYQFQTECDTEVVMAAYLTWGRDCISRLRGMFAFGIYDHAQGTLWLARDRFGIKPLYYSLISGQLVFASSVSAILEHPRFSKRPNLEVLSHYLSTTRTSLGRRIVYEGIEQLLPSEQLLWRDGRATISRYWQYPTSKCEMEYDDAVDQLQEQLDAATKIRLRSDRPVGMFLSGGVDSSTLGGLIRAKVPAGMYAACASAKPGVAGRGVSEQEEGEFAERAAQLNGFELEHVQLDGSQYRDAWRQLIEQLRLPLSTPSDVSIYGLARAAKRQVATVLGGEGSDELLCGYEVAHWAGHDFDATRQTHARSRPSARLLGAIETQYGRRQFVNEADHYFALNSLIPLSLKPHVMSPVWYQAALSDLGMLDYYQSLYRQYDGSSTVEKNAIVLHQVNLESLLSRLDMMTMHAGLEARVPFTDHQLVESMFRMPFKYRIDAKDEEAAATMASAELAAQGTLRPKRMLRSLARRLMSREMAERKKASFPTGVAVWFRTVWRDWIRDTLTESEFAKVLFQDSFRRELIKTPERGGMWLWPTMNLCLWGDREFC